MQIELSVNGVLLILCRSRRWRDWNWAKRRRFIQEQAQGNTNSKFKLAGVEQSEWNQPLGLSVVTQPTLFGI